MKTIVLTNRDHWSHRLAALGLSVHSVGDWQELREAIRSVQGRLAVVDVDSFAPPGPETLGAMRHESVDRICLAALTTRSDPDWLGHLTAAGFDDVWDAAVPVYLASRVAVAVGRLAPIHGCPHRGSSLCNAEKELRAVYQGTLDGVLVIDVPTMRVLRANPMACQITGCSQEELLNASVADLHGAAALSDALETFRNAAERERFYLEGIRCRRKDGSPFRADIATFRLRDGGCEQLLCFLRDVTKPHDTAEALARSETRFRAIFESAALGLAMTDLRGTIVLANERFAEMVGRSRDSLPGISIRQLTHSEDWPSEREAFGRFLEGGGTMIRLEKRYLRPDGAVAWGRVSGSVLFDATGAPRHFLGVVEDVTERKAVEEARRKAEEAFLAAESNRQAVEQTFRELVENMPDFVILLDTHAKILFANEKSPVPVDRLVGQIGFGFLRPEYVESAQRAFGETVQQRQVRRLEVCSNSDEWWDCRLVPLADGNVVVRVMIICTLITERKQAEQAIRREQDLLRQMLDLAERDRELVAFELHDVIAQNLAAALMQLEAAAAGDPARTEAVQQALQTGMDLLRRTVSESRRLVSGLRPPVLDAFGVVAAIEHLIIDGYSRDEFRAELIARGRIGRLPRSVENAVFRIVQEALANARRHSGAPRARVELACAEGALHIEVSDEGVGFDPAAVAPGTFGIPGIRERARLLGGWARFDAAPGKGTRLTVHLPIAFGAERIADQEDAAGDNLGGL